MLMILARIPAEAHFISIWAKLLITGVLLAPRLSFSIGLAADVVARSLLPLLFGAYPCKLVGCFWLQVLHILLLLQVLALWSPVVGI